MSEQQPHDQPSVVAHTTDEDEPDSALSWFGGALVAVAVAVFVWTPWGASMFGDGQNRGRRAGFKNLIDDLGQSGVTLIALGVAVLFVVVGAFTLRAERRGKA